MTYPGTVLTKNRKEARILVEKGEYIKYTYINLKTNKPIKGRKYSLILESEYSKRHLFIIPLKGKKSMIVG